MPDQPIPRADHSNLPAWGFAFPGPLRDKLTRLALEGTKTATAGLLVEVDLDDETLPVVGTREVLLDSGQQPVAVLETVACSIVRLADVDDQHAIDEGEGYANAVEFRESHERFWNGYINELRNRLGNPSFAIDDDTLVVLQRFRIVDRLDGDTAGAGGSPS